MKIDFVSAPPPLTFGRGDEAFTLSLKRVDAAERAAVLDAIQASSHMQVQAELERCVVGWANVCDANGVAVSFEEEDEKGRKTRNLSKFLGALALVDQMRVMVGLLAFIGIPTESADGIIKQLMAAGDTGRLGGAARPTPSSDANTKTPASES